MTAWSDYSTGERVKILRGDLTQRELAERAGVSWGLVQKIEQNHGAVKVASLMAVADALGTDISVVLGQQAPKRAMSREERTGLRELSLAVHATGLLPVPDDLEPGDIAGLRGALQQAWKGYWNGDYTSALGVAPALITQARALAVATNGRTQEQALWVLADALQVGACVANLMGKHDLAFAAISHAKTAATASGDELLNGVLSSALAWVYLRDGRLDLAVDVAERAAADIAPSFADGTPERLSVFGNLMVRAAVSASRRPGNEDRARDFLGQAHAAAARIGADRNDYQTLFGPTAAHTHAVELAIAFGQFGKAHKLIEEKKGQFPRSLPMAAWSRYQLNVALVLVELRKWDTATRVLLGLCEKSPEWLRHQALAGVIAQRIGDHSTEKLREVTRLVGVPLVPQ